MDFKKTTRMCAAVIIAACAAMIGLLVKAWWDGQFSSVETLQEYIAGFGLFAPIVLTFIQAAQVVIPVLPGFLGCAVGAVLFGWLGGFLCNYIGISLGSIAAFYLAKHFGIRLVEGIFTKEKYNKWSGWAAKSHVYTLFLFAGMVLPLFPDDFFCYFSGLTEMSGRKFSAIVALGKPWCILVYSLGFALIK